jgi:hypothetical protein
MKTILKRGLLATALVLVLAFIVTLTSHHLSAQAPAGATPVTQTSTDLRSATVCASVDAASGSATLTPPAGQSVYLQSVELNVGGSGTVTAAAPIKATSSGLAGTPTFGLFRSDAMTLGQVGNPVFIAFPNGLRGLTNTAVSVTGGAVTNLVWHITICGYYAQ